MIDLISRQAAIDAVMNTEPVFDTNLEPHQKTKDVIEAISNLPSAQPGVDLFPDVSEEYKRGYRDGLRDKPEPQWNNHTVACLLADMYGDTCACNYNDISDWLPEKCELLDSCPNPVGVGCWEQFLKHRAERREDG